MSRRYIVRLSKDNTTFEVSDRLVVENFRRQSKGLGSATFKIISRMSLDQTPSESENPRFKQSNLLEQESENGLIKETTTISIHDTTLGDDEGPGNRVFYGFITNVSAKTVKGLIKDAQGIVNANEIGWRLTNGVVSGVYFDKSGRELSTPPAFNPSVNGITFGNKSPGQLRFLGNFNDFASTNNEEWLEEDLDKVWNRKDVVDVISQSAGDYGLSLNVVYPKDDSGEEYKYFIDKSKVRGWESLEGQTISKALDTLIEDPLSYYIDYTSSFGGFDLIIYNKSVTDVVDGDDDVFIPGTSGKTVYLNSIYPPVTDLTVSEVQGQVDRVTVRGAPIVCCGTFTFWEYQNMHTMIPGWRDYSSNEYFTRNYQEFAYVRGSKDSDTVEIDASTATKVRAELKDVYQRFLFNYYQDEVIVVNSNPGNTNEFTEDYSLRALCPRFTFMDEFGSILTTPEFRYDVEGKDPSELREYHSTPNPLSLKFGKVIPVYNTTTVYQPGVGDVEVNNELIPPLLMAPSVIQGRDFPSFPGEGIGGDLVWYSLTSPGASQTARLNFRYDGVFIELKEPTLYSVVPSVGDYYKLWVEKEWTSGPEYQIPFTGGNSRRPLNLWTSNTAPSINNIFQPYVDRVPSGKFGSHWSRFVLTAALQSDQRLEISKTRTEFDEGTGSFANVEVVNEHVINDPSLEIWFIHDNTVIGPEGQRSLRRQNGDTLVRNDTPLAKNILDNAFSWLSQSRSIATIEYQVNNCDLSANPSSSELITTVGQYQIGAMIGNIIEDVSYTINTAIESIEVDATNGIMTINTDSPKMPVLRKLAHTTVPASSPNFSYQIDRRSTTSEDSDKRPQAPEQPIVGDLTAASGGGGTSAAEKLFIAKVASPAIALPDPNDDDVDEVDVIPDIEDWTELDLEFTWDESDGFEDTPTGLCYLKLVRPYEFNGKSYAADILKPLEDKSTDIVPNRVISDPDDLNTLYFFWNKKDLNYDLPAKTFQITVGANDYNMLCLTNSTAEVWDESGGTKLSDISLEEIDYGFKATFNPRLWNEDDTLEIQFPSAAVNTGTDVSVSRFITGVIGSDANKYVFGLVHVDNQSYSVGQNVIVSREEINVADDLDETRVVYRILGPSDQTQDPGIFVIEGGNDLGYFSGFTGIKFTADMPTITQADKDADLDSLPTLTDGLGYGRNLQTNQRELILHTNNFSPNTVDIPEGMIVYAPETTVITINEGTEDETTVTVRIPVLMG